MRKLLLLLIILVAVLPLAAADSTLSPVSYDGPSQIRLEGTIDDKGLYYTLSSQTGTEQENLTEDTSFKVGILTEKGWESPTLSFHYSSNLQASTSSASIKVSVLKPFSWVQGELLDQEATYEKVVPTTITRYDGNMTSVSGHTMLSFPSQMIPPGPQTGSLGAFIININPAPGYYYPAGRYEGVVVVDISPQ